MFSLRQLVVAFGALCFAGTPLFGGKVPLRPEELLAESKLIAVGKVQSHRDQERTHSDGSRIKDVFLALKVESVEKGDEIVKPGDTIDVVCWTVVKAPPRGEVWDGGHFNMPGDGGRARFFLENRMGDAWSVIYPNWIERLDETPVLSYPFESAERPAATDELPTAETGRVSALLLIVLGVIGLVVCAAFVALVSSRKNRSE